MAPDLNIFYECTPANNCEQLLDLNLLTKPLAQYHANVFDDVARQAPSAPKGLNRRRLLGQPVLLVANNDAEGLRVMLNAVPRETAHSLAFSVKEACAKSSLGRTTFYKYLKLGKIPAHKCGRRTIILLDELQLALKSLPRAGGAS